MFGNVRISLTNYENELNSTGQYENVLKSMKLYRNALKAQERLKNTFKEVWKIMKRMKYNVSKSGNYCDALKILKRMKILNSMNKFDKV